mmetsp:Transcript_52425/g.152584  ORF Transcript_52425/g.152584 Transcript_52425/m.152584 type:complete len:346 (+) Transcript_52425:145-1182(+)
MQSALGSQQPPEGNLVLCRWHGQGEIFAGRFEEHGAHGRPGATRGALDAYSAACMPKLPIGSWDRSQRPSQACNCGGRAKMSANRGRTRSAGDGGGYLGPFPTRCPGYMAAKGAGPSMARSSAKMFTGDTVSAAARGRLTMFVRIAPRPLSDAGHPRSSAKTSAAVASALNHLPAAEAQGLRSSCCASQRGMERQRPRPRSRSLAPGRRRRQETRGPGRPGGNSQRGAASKRPCGRLGPRRTPQARAGCPSTFSAPRRSPWAKREGRPAATRTRMSGRSPRGRRRHWRTLAMRRRLARRRRRPGSARRGAARQACSSASPRPPRRHSSRRSLAACGPCGRTWAGR